MKTDSLADYTIRNWSDSLDSFCFDHNISNSYYYKERSEYFSGYLDHNKIAGVLNDHHDNMEKRVRAPLAICDVAFERIAHMDRAIESLRVEIAKRDDEMSTIR
jgi:hypothetical protein